MNRLICIFFLFFNTTIYAYSELYESDLYYLQKNEVLLYKILNWWSNESQKNNTEFCFNNIRVRSNKTLNLNYDKRTKILKLNTKEKFADLISIFENKNSYLKSNYVNKKYFKSLKAENIKKLNMISLENVSLREYERVNKVKNNIAFEVEGKVAGLLTYSGQISFYESGEFLRACPKNSGEEFDIVFKILNTKTKEVLVKYLKKAY